MADNSHSMTSLVLDVGWSITGDIFSVVIDNQNSMA